MPRRSRSQAEAEAEGGKGDACGADREANQVGHEVARVRSQEWVHGDRDEDRAFRLEEGDDQVHGGTKEA